MAARVHYLVVNLRAPGDEPRLVKERHSSLEEARQQALHDLELGGRNIVGIEDAKGELVWEP